MVQGNVIFFHVFVSKLALLLIFITPLAFFITISNDGLLEAQWQIKGVRSIGRPKRRWRDDNVGPEGAIWSRTAMDRERWRTLAEGYFLQWKDTA